MNEFSKRNRKRCESPTGFKHQLGDWTLNDWMTALVGEVGEAANIIKKLNRYRDGIPGNTQTKEELENALRLELADVFIYLDLIFQVIGTDPEQVVEEKFQITSKKIGYVENPHV